MRFDLRLKESRFFLYSLSLLFVATVLLFYFTQHVTDEDRLHYKQLMALRACALKERTYTAEQQRKEVQKDLICCKNGQRLQMRLQGEKAKIVFNRKVGVLEVKEYLDNVHCWLQERVFSRLEGGESVPAQALFFFKADAAIYDQNKERFETTAVTLTHQEMKGETLPFELPSDPPLLTGKAEKAVVYFVSGQPRLEAFHFSGSVLTGEEAP